MNVKFLLKTLNLENLQTNLKWKFIDRFFSNFSRSKLKSLDFSIIGNNCFAGGIYHKFGLKYNTPTIWTYIFPDDYLRFIENLDWYLKQPLKFKKTTNHTMAHQFYQITHKTYPIGVLGDIEIHFMHSQSEQEALEKWSRRLKRLNLNNLFFVFSDGVEFKEEMLGRFEELPYKHKIFFSSKPYSYSKCTVFIEDYAKATHVPDSTRNRKYEKYLDLVKWLNGEDNFLKK